MIITSEPDFHALSRCIAEPSDVLRIGDTVAMLSGRFNRLTASVAVLG